jgi:alkanesulfonate monooxygenase SsuD/methylene tetrahydromethanopterin reductase-like flavin-dependent oxidoreductase (luciferase family)
MRHAIDLPNFGDYGDPGLLAGLAREAEDHGWDAFFIWDHMIAPGAVPVADTAQHRLLKWGSSTFRAARAGRGNA